VTMKIRSAFNSLTWASSAVLESGCEPDTADHWLV
jgi:hypothetical protein